MRNILGILFLLFTWTINAQVKWMTMQEVKTAMEKEPRKVLMDVYADWCGPCKLMDKNTYGDSEISKYINENFYAVKFNAEGNDKFEFKDREFSNPNYVEGKVGARHEFAQYLAIYSYPSTVFFDENFEPITNLRGYFDAQEFKPYLILFATKAYEKIKSQADWERFQKKIKPEVEN